MRISDWSSDVCSSDLETLGIIVAEGETVEGDDAGVYAQAGAVEVENDGTIRGNDTGGIILEQPNSIIDNRGVIRSEEHTSELQSLMRISYAVFCLKKKIHSPNTKSRNKNIRKHTHNK